MKLNSIIFTLFLFIAAGCMGKINRDYAKAESAVLEKYQSASVDDAWKGLLDFRKEIVESNGFGSFDSAKLLMIVDARLMYVAWYKKDKTEMQKWYRSHLDFRVKSRSDSIDPGFTPSEEDVLKMVDKLDNKLKVKWKLHGVKS